VVPVGEIQDGRPVAELAQQGDSQESLVGTDAAVQVQGLIGIIRVIVAVAVLRQLGAVIRDVLDEGHGEFRQLVVRPAFGRGDGFQLGGQAGHGGIARLGRQEHAVKSVARGGRADGAGIRIDLGRTLIGLIPSRRQILGDFIIVVLILEIKLSDSVYGRGSSRDRGYSQGRAVKAVILSRSASLMPRPCARIRAKASAGRPR